MAVKLIANYAKRLGLPGYSSHQFSVSIETELQNLENIAHDSARLYESLQSAVDQQIQKTGFIPPNGYGMEPDKDGAWNCSQKQRELDNSPFVPSRWYCHEHAYHERSQMSRHFCVLK